jgi:adenylylsulfate kinase-like enzyme
VSDPYEAPESPEVRVETEGREPGDSAREVLDHLAVRA